MTKLILIAMLIALSASARIGETKVECIKRYGKPTEETKESKTEVNELYFNKSGYSITTYFIKGICKKIMFSKHRRTTGRNLSENEIAILLKPYGNIKINKDISLNTYSQVNGRITGFSSRHLLILETPEFDAFNKIKEIAKQKADLSDF